MRLTFGSPNCFHMGYHSMVMGVILHDLLPVQTATNDCVSLLLQRYLLKSLFLCNKTATMTCFIENIFSGRVMC